MTQIVINCEHGGFGLSQAAQIRYSELSGQDFPEFRWEIARDCPHLVQVVKELGSTANAPYANLKVVDIPDGVSWQIDEYGGNEWIAEIHRTWR